MAEGLFRPEAVSAYENPEARGGLLVARPPSGWLPLTGIVGALLVGLAVASQIRVDVTAEGRGLVRTAGGNVVVRAPRGGVVGEVRARTGDVLETTDLIAQIDDLRIQAPQGGVVEYVDVRAGDVVALGAPVAELAPSSEPLVAFMAIPTTHRGRVEPGTRVRLRLDEDRGPSAAAAWGTVERVGAELLSDERGRSLLGALAPKEPSYLVELRLESAPGGADFRSGMSFTGAVTLERPTVLELLLPSRRGE